VAQADKVVDTFLQWIDRNAGKPFFAYLHFMDCHLPYRPPRKDRLLFETDGEYKGKFPPDRIMIEEEDEIRDHAADLSAPDRKHIIAMYDASIHYLDSEIGRLLDALSSKGLLEHTVVIILSDHGEEFFEHGGFGHGYSLYNELIRTPFILWHPDLNVRDLRIRQTVRQIDIYPTLLSLLNLRPRQGLLGVDLSPLFLHPENDLKLPAYSEKAHGYISLQQSGKKLIRKFVSKSKVLEFYDLTRDPNEKDPLPMDDPSLHVYETELETHEKVGDRRDTPDIGRPDEEDLRRLKSLGYLH
jgi:arylsulfatase A-like enzyme